MTNLILAFRIKRLTKKAKFHYRAYRDLWEIWGGGELADKGTEGLANHHKDKFNSIMDKLTTLDPEAPKRRL